ncbi:hypothetical protein [Paenibacillus sp. YIM B09110]|uniref:hypothetical protein n=1 Tax=Paenibacillus sp. YIM B09110 TaxID=3126102 RepID=UPI00301C0C50
MKTISVMGIVLLTAVILIAEWRSNKQEEARKVSAGVTIFASLLAIVLLYYPSLPGPTQFVKLIFGKVDKIIK